MRRALIPMGRQIASSALTAMTTATPVRPTVWRTAVTAKSVHDIVPRNIKSFVI